MLVNITNLDEFGRGITRINGKVSFVINALPNEEVEAEIIEEKSKYNILKSNKIVKKSNDRQDAICPYYLECGGCNIMHMSYQKQKQLDCQLHLSNGQSLPRQQEDESYLQ